MFIQAVSQKISCKAKVGAVAIRPVRGFDGVLIYIGTIAIPIYSTFIIGLISPPHPQNVYDMLHRIMYLLYHNVLY